MGETRVDLLHLLEDLRDAYPGPIEETILTEVVANSLDSGASEIRILADPAGGALTVVDDGAGMRRRELARYHDLAATTKSRGQGIGFAGVGIKLGLLVAQEVLTESRRGATGVATRWHLASPHRAPWKWVPPPGLVNGRGTAVRLALPGPLSPLLDRGFLEAALARHFRPLLDPTFDALLGRHYPRGVRLLVNGRALPRATWDAAETAPIAVHLARKRKPSAVGILVREPGPLPEAHRGVAVSTLGKVIKQGWDWLGLTPATADRIAGLIEVPALAECLTLSKADFVRSGPRGALYLAYRKAIQECVSRQLGAWGDARSVTEDARRRVARPLERDLQHVLDELAEDFPLLAALVDRQAGGQRRLPMGRRGSAEAAPTLVPVADGAGRPVDDAPAGQEGYQADAGTRAAEASGPGAPAGAPPSAEPAEGTPGASTGASGAGAPRLAGAGGPRRSGRYALSIQFEERPADDEIGRLVESTVYVNAAHPAYRRAAASRSEGYHLALAVALALAPLCVEAAHEHAFVSAFLARWGEALGPTGRRRPGRPRGSGRTATSRSA